MSSGAEATGLPSCLLDGCEERTMFADGASDGQPPLEYRIRIAYPRDEAPPAGYPVIYALDGDAVFLTLAEAVRLQTRKPHGYDPAIVVGIGYPSREPFDTERRCFDFTPPSGEGVSLPVRPDGRPWPRNGGADAFLDFVSGQLMPAIARDFPIDPARQAIFGHSLGGLLVLYALFTRPLMFGSYVAGSPSVWWGEYAVLQEQRRFAERYGEWNEARPDAASEAAGADTTAQRPTAGKIADADTAAEPIKEAASVVATETAATWSSATAAGWGATPIIETAAAPSPVHPCLLITIGGDELPDMLGDARQLAVTLQSLTDRGFPCTFAEFPGEDHVSVLPAALSRLVRFALAEAK